MKKTMVLAVVIAAFFIGMVVGPLRIGAATPGILSYQGRVLVSSAPFTGTGQFKFALVNAAGSTTFWSNDGTSTNGSEPTAAVSLAVNNGLYSVLLGDTTISGMTQAIPATAFDNADVRLRIWFNDGTNGSKLLSPDQRIAPVGYAQVAKSVDDGSITSSKVAAFPRCSVFNSAELNVNTTATININFDSERLDNDNIHDTATNPENLVCRTAGSYLLGLNITANCGSTGNVLTEIRVNGAPVAVDLRPVAAIGAVQVSMSRVIQLSVNDIVTAAITNNSNQTLTVRVLPPYSPEMTMSKLP